VTREVKIWSVFGKEWGILTIRKNAKQTENQLFFDPSKNGDHWETTTKTKEKRKYRSLH